MSTLTYQLLAQVATAWCVLTAVKAWTCLRANTPYEFRIWDGGLMRAGKRLTRRGTQIKLATGALMALGVVAFFTGLLPRQPTIYALVAIAILGFIAELATTE